jgi:ZIP family zinc transporter
MSDGILIVLGLALLPALGNLAGGLLAEWRDPSQQMLNRALHAATGSILAVIAVEVMPAALGVAAAWLLALAFLAGGGTYLLVQFGIEGLQQTQQGGVGAGAWMVYVAVATDLIGDGLLIGAGSAVSSQTALMLALGKVLADVPEGFAVIANFRDKGVSRVKRLLLSASFGAPVLSAAVFAYFALRSQSEALKMAALVFVAGLYTLPAIEEMLREAHETADDSRWSAISFLAGFALFLLLSGIQPW